jgi:virginiamycin B lyase
MPTAKISKLITALFLTLPALSSQQMGVGAYSVPTYASLPIAITAGSDGALWFTEFSANKIGRITTAGMVTEYPVPTADSGPIGITSGPDGALWFAESNLYAGLYPNMGRITTAGAITEYPVPVHDARPIGIATGPDGEMWLADNNENKIIEGFFETANLNLNPPAPSEPASVLPVAHFLPARRSSSSCAALGRTCSQARRRIPPVRLP